MADAVWTHQSSNPLKAMRVVGLLATSDAEKKGMRRQFPRGNVEIDWFLFLLFSARFAWPFLHSLVINLRIFNASRVAG